MANYRKSFNFRSGVQVDNDSFLVDPRGNVGIGTSITNRPLDVYGAARVNGNLETESLKVSLGSTFSSLVTIGSSIFANPNTGIISAVSYRGDGTLLAGVIAIATNGWVVNAGTLATHFNTYIGPFDENAGPGEGLQYLPVAEGLLQVGKGSSTFVVQSTGLVGLGTTIPNVRLDVRGNSLITGILTVTDKIQGNTLSISSNSNITGNLDVDGNTELDDLNVSNLTTLNTLNVSGIATLGFATATRVVSKNLEVSGISTILGQFRMQKNQAFYMGITGETANGLFFRHTDTLGAEIANLSNLGGNDRKITIQSTYDGDIILKGQSTNRAVFTTNGAAITGITSTNALIVSGLSTLTNAQVTGTLTAPSIIGNLTGIASEANRLSDGANITTGTISDERLPNLITSNLSTVAGISTINKLRVETLGIGTDTFTSDIALVKDSSVRLEVISKQGSATIGLGQSETGGTNSAGIKYNTIAETFDITSYGSGDVSFHVHKGTGDVVGTQTGGFLFKTGSVDRVLLNIGSDGRVSVNEELPELSDLGYSLIVNGNTKVRGGLNLDQGINSSGIITALSLRLTENSVFPTSQNFNVQSGVSTFYKLQVANQLTSVGFTSFIGIATFFGGFETKANVQLNNDTLVKGTRLGLSTSNLFYDYVGGITTGFLDPRDQSKLVPLSLDPTHTILPFAGYGDMQVRTGGINIITQDYIAIQPSLTQAINGNWPGLTPTENIGMGLEFINWNLCKVGINTLYIRSIFDVGYGNSSNSSYFIPPRLSTNEIYAVSQLWNANVASDWQGHARAKLATPDGLVTGGIVFDHQRNQLKVAVGSTTFTGIATFTNNHSGYEAFVPPKVTSAQRTTLTNGGLPEGAIVYNTETDTLQQYDGTNWSSLVKQTGITTQATISVIGSKIFFTVAGIGSTSLTLL